MQRYTRASSEQARFFGLVSFHSSAHAEEGLLLEVLERAQRPPGPAAWPPGPKGTVRGWPLRQAKVKVLVLV